MLRKITGYSLLLPIVLMLGCAGSVEDIEDSAASAVTGEGLTAQYFKGTAFNTQVLGRTDAKVNFHWTDATPPGVPRTQFSVRWTGFLTPARSGTYSISAGADDGVRVWVAGQELVNDWSAHSFRESGGKIALTAGKAYVIKVEYYQAGGLAGIQLFWESAAVPRTVIPSSALSPAAGGGTGTSTGTAAGLFITRADLARAKTRLASGAKPYADSYGVQKGRANGALNTTPDPFHATDMKNLGYDWGSKFSCSTTEDNKDDSLHDLTGKLTRDSDRMRTLALQFALTGDRRYGDKAMAFMKAWATQGTFVNLHDFHIDYQKAAFDGETEGLCSHRPWNFALDTIFQTYGAINFSDAYLLLSLNGYGMTSAEDAQVQGMLKKLAAALNSGFQAWTRWADFHASGSSSYIRYRSDNHLSWALAGLLALGAATHDPALMGYVVDGTSWTDPRGGASANSNSIKSVIDYAVVAGSGTTADEIFEETICRDPPVGYSMFHLWAMQLTVRAAEVQLGRSLWDHKGADGAGMEDAYKRYLPFLEEKKLPHCSALDSPGAVRSYIWVYDLASQKYPGNGFESLVNSTGRSDFIIQSIGPVSLLLGR